MPYEIDIREDHIAMLDAGLLKILLKDHTTSKPDEIKAELITGSHGKVIIL